MESTTVSATATATSTIIPTPFHQAPVDISLLSDGQTVRVNLARFTGSMPSPDARVLVNDTDVTVNGTDYYAYVNLEEGANAIEVTTVTGSETSTDTISICFNPPLTGHLFNPALDSTINYLEYPGITINGDISNPLARVEVNGEVQEVRADGSFTVDYTCVPGSNTVTMVATLDDDTDMYLLRWQVNDNGHIGIVSGHYYYPTSPYGNLFTTSLIESDNEGFLFDGDYSQTIELKAGQSAVVNFGVSIGKENTVPLEASAVLAGTDVPGLHVEFDDLGFIAYPRMQYLFPVTISVGTEVTPGEYSYTVTYSDTKKNLDLRLTVNVL